MLNVKHVNTEMRQECLNPTAERSC